MKRLFLIMLCAALLLLCGCDRDAETPNTTFDGPYPGDFQPVLRVNDTLYSWAGYSYDYVVAEGDNSVGVVAGETMLPQGYEELGEIAAVTEDAPEEMELRADFKATGTIYTNPQQPEAIYVLLKSSALQKDSYIRFVTPVLETPTLSYKGSLYAIGDFEDLKKDLPEGYTPIGSLTYIGRDLIPELDFETNCFTDCYSKTLDGRQVYGSETNTVTLYLSQTKYSALGDSQCYIPCTYLGSTESIPRLESAFDETAAFFFRGSGEAELTYNFEIHASGKIAEERQFSSLQLELEKAGVIPVIEACPIFNSSAKYDADGTPMLLSFLWGDTGGTYATKQLTLTILSPEMAEVGPLWLIDHQKATKTQVGEVTVYGAATEIDHLLEATLPDGSVCQITGYAETPLEDMILLLDHLITGGVRYEAMSMEHGVNYGPVEPDAVREVFAPCLPEPLGLPLALQSQHATAMDDIPVSYTQYYNYEADGSFLEYTATTKPSDPELLQNYLGELDEISEDDILTILEDEFVFSFLRDDLAVTVCAFNIPPQITLELIRSLPDYPHKEELPDAAQFFRDNTGQEGGNVVACGLIGEGYMELDFSSQIGQLMKKNALPVIRGTDTPEVAVSYVDEVVTGIRVCWPHGMKLRITAPGLVPDVSYQVEKDACTQAEINGITVYGDGTKESDEKALLFTLPEGSSCEIVALPTVPVEDMVRVLQFLLENGVNYNAFDFALGDFYQQISLEELPEFFSDFVPTEPEGLALQEVWLRRRNGTPIYARLVYYDEEGAALEWEIFYSDLYKDASYQEDMIGNAAYVTKQDCVRELDEAGSVGGFQNGSSIYLHVSPHRDGMGSTIYEMLQTIKLI